MYFNKKRLIKIFLKFSSSILIFRNIYFSKSPGSTFCLKKFSDGFIFQKVRNANMRLKLARDWQVHVFWLGTCSSVVNCDVSPCLGLLLQRRAQPGQPPGFFLFWARVPGPLENRANRYGKHAEEATASSIPLCSWRWDWGRFGGAGRRPFAD